MKGFWAKHSEKIIITIIIIVVVLVIWYAGKQRGKSTAEGPQAEYPEGGNEIPSNWSPEPIVSELYDVMSGWALTGTKDSAWIKLRDLPTNEMVIAVYNVFNQKYFGEGYGTLVQWIRDEAYYDYFSGVKEGTLARLQNLGLQ